VRQRLSQSPFQFYARLGRAIKAERKIRAVMRNNFDMVIEQRFEVGANQEGA
jgi:hypothetical protein